MDERGTLNCEGRCHSALRLRLCDLNSAKYRKVVWLYNVSMITEREAAAMIATANEDSGS